MSRHRTFDSAMSALLAYKNRPEGAPVPVSTNWAIVPANDNEPEVTAKMHAERRIQILPTVEEIMRQVESGDIERNDTGQIIRIGRLKFSDGTQVEAGHKYGPGGEVVSTKHRMPTGAMLGCQEKESRTLGGDEKPSHTKASNNYFLNAFGVGRRERIPSGKKAKRTYQTHAEAKEELAKAYANTPVLPPVTKCPPGLPNASSKIADSFLGMRKTTIGESGSERWQDVSTALIDLEIWEQALKSMSERDRTVLNIAAHSKAKTYTDIGIAIGLSPLYSKYNGGGKRALKSANDNLGEKIKKLSA